MRVLRVVFVLGLRSLVIWERCRTQALWDVSAQESEVKGSEEELRLILRPICWAPANR